MYVLDYINYLQLYLHKYYRGNNTRAVLYFRIELKQKKLSKDH